MDHRIQTPQIQDETTTQVRPSPISGLRRSFQVVHSKFPLKWILTSFRPEKYPKKIGIFFVSKSLLGEKRKFGVVLTLYSHLFNNPLKWISYSMSGSGLDGSYFFETQLIWAKSCLVIGCQKKNAKNLKKMTDT